MSKRPRGRKRKFWEASQFLAEQYNRGRGANYGYWVPPEGIAPLAVRVGAVSVPQIMAGDEAKDTALWPYLFKAFPSWSHGLQGTGDCVSWSWGHLFDVLMGVQVAQGAAERIVAQVAQESVYGFGRVEIYGRPDYSGPGMYGGAALKAVTQFGTLHRLQYNGDDLRRYSGTRAIQWGRTGVPDRLESTAADHQAIEGLVVTDCVLAGALIQQGYPVTYCGSTVWGRERNADGIATRFSSGAHAMTLTGVRYRNHQPFAFWNANTGHGHHCNGPVGPLPMPAVYAECGSWLPADRVEPVLRRGDCHAVSLYEGFPSQDLPDWGSDQYL